MIVSNPGQAFKANLQSEFLFVFYEGAGALLDLSILKIRFLSGIRIRESTYSQNYGNSLAINGIVSSPKRRGGSSTRNNISKKMRPYSSISALFLTKGLTRITLPGHSSFCFGFRLSMSSSNCFCVFSSRFSFFFNLSARRSSIVGTTSAFRSMISSFLASA